MPVRLCGFYIQKYKCASEIKSFVVCGIHGGDALRRHADGDDPLPRHGRISDARAPFGAEADIQRPAFVRFDLFQLAAAVIDGGEAADDEHLLAEIDCGAACEHGIRLRAGADDLRAVFRQGRILQHILAVLVFRVVFRIFVKDAARPVGGEPVLPIFYILDDLCPAPRARNKQRQRRQQRQQRRQDGQTFFHQNSLPDAAAPNGRLFH